jgi:glycosyltransferase involved in cell wall biosynthesis
VKVVHLSTGDITGGGAFRATYRLHKQLQQLGHQSLMLVLNKISDDAAVVEFAPATDLMSRLWRRLRAERIARDFARYQASRPAGYEPFSDDRSRYTRELVAQLPSCDIVNLHWVASYLDYATFFSSVPDRTPVVWRLADMNAFTGGCHYDDGCGRFRQRCGECPQLGSTQSNDLSRRVWKRKEAVFRTVDPARLHIVALCRWMAEEVQQSPLLSRFPRTIIPNGIDTEMFSARDRRTSRELLGIPENMRVVLFAANDVTNRRKGLRLLSDALIGQTTISDLLLVSVGHAKPALDSRIPHLHLGHIEYKWLSLAYTAADVFVIPSLQENFGNVVLESMACGTPVVGFDVGGIPDVVRPGITGSLVTPYDVLALRAAILGLVQNEKKRREMSRNCRQIAVDEYSLDLQARRYSELYKSLLKAKRPSGHRQ